MKYTRQSGMTLLEVIVAMAIILILLSIASGPLGSSSARMQLKSAARELVSSMQLARTSAIRDTHPWAIQFDNISQNYEVYSNSGEAWHSENWSDGDETTNRTISLNSSVRFGTQQGVPTSSYTEPADGISFSANRVVFNPNGTSESGTVYLTISSGDTLAITSLSTTGNIRVWHNYGDGWVR